MRRKASTLVALTGLLFAWLLVGFVSPAHSQNTSPTTHPIDVVIVLDDSGSMGTCWPWIEDDPQRYTRKTDCPNNPPSDPNNLRYSAARLLVQLADDNDQVAFVRFGSYIEPIGSAELEQVGGPSNRAAMVSTIQPPSDYQIGGYTRIDLGLERAADILANRENPQRPGYILFLTDGEPTQPENTPQQRDAVTATVGRLTQAGIRIFPVALCNQACPSGFLRDTMGSAREAHTADQLLKDFSAILAEMKPGLHIVDQLNADGALEFFTRATHGARQLNVVTAKGAFTSLERDGAADTRVATTFGDDNIEVNVLESSALPDARWTVRAQDASGFVVARTETYPEVLHPPSSIPGSSTAPRFVPRGKPALLVATTVGPGGGEPLLLNEQTPLKPLTPDEGQRWAALSDATETFTLQVGTDIQPLQIIRDFNLVPMDGLPPLQASTPTCIANQPCHLEVAFNPGAEVSEVAATLYVADISSSEETPVYVQPMTCADRTCVDESFTPQDGHIYVIRFAAQARSQNLLFGDWAETTLAMRPAIYVRGLPDPLGLEAQPPDGWPITIVAGTTQDMGRLRATLVLNREDGGETVPVEGVTALFSADIRGAGEQQTTLRIEGVENLQPGHYTGQLTFNVDTPPQGEGETVQMPAPIVVDFNLSKPRAVVRETGINFGSVPFIQGPLDVEYPLEVNFSENAFSLTPTIESSQGSDCPPLHITADTPQQQDTTSYTVMLHLQSDVPVIPQTCRGTLALHGPSENFEVQSSPSISWRVEVQPIEWDLLGAVRDDSIESAASFTDFGYAGERGMATLLVRYSGSPPFSLRLQNLDATDTSGQRTLEASAVNLIVTAPPEQQDGQVYRVPVALEARSEIPHEKLLLGALYSGRLHLTIGGLPGEEQTRTIPFSFRSPSLLQRYILPIYRWWLPGIVTIPLTLFLLLGIPFLLIMAGRDKRARELIEEERSRREELEWEEARRIQSPEDDTSFQDIDGSGENSSSTSFDAPPTSSMDSWDDGWNSGTPPWQQAETGWTDNSRGGNGTANAPWESPSEDSFSDAPSRSAPWE